MFGCVKAEQEGVRAAKGQLKSGDTSVTTKDTTRSVHEDVAHLWLSLDDRARDHWINFDVPFGGEGQRFDAYMEKLIADGRILCIPVGTRVRVLGTSSEGKDDWENFYEVEILEGEFSGRTGWLSYFGLEHS